MHRLLSTTLLLLLPLFATATSIFDQLNLADPHAALPVTLSLPFDSIIARSSEDQKGVFSFTDATGIAQDWSVKISLRGKFRRTRCGMPPLKLDFSKKDLRIAGLTSYDKYKLVVPCYESAEAQELVLKEYLAYQAYALVTPTSFRTQLLELTIRDENGGSDRIVTAFLIENTDEMAERIGGEDTEVLLGAPAEHYAAEAEATHALFQFLIGNGDYSLLMRRNVKIVTIGDEKLPVGYDFDFAGWVDAHYASPNGDVGQTDLSERIYLGYAQSDDIMERATTKFRDKRREVLKLIRSSDLSYESRLELDHFATSFFSQLNRLKSDRDLTLYDQLRGEVASLIPMGEDASNFQSFGK
ncbi:hypothetical protein [Neolewinella antarctica]|uniref:Uncharacterized protein n=1 Tax=Neolewinella antarctica TaxID=442734 RepID=A0ABX0XAZ8_9BACT|nr:hypothetical protein [Neolewinella antarctica]NJC26454.1 hypothetical protein [Neolewinella antarctica]